MSGSDDLNLLLGLGNRNEGNTADVNAAVDLGWSLPVFSLRWFDRALDACFGSEAKLTDNFVSRPNYWKR